jgi:hypothetical protein
LVPFYDLAEGIVVPLETFSHQFGIILSGRFHFFECYHIRPYAPEKGREVTKERIKFCCNGLWQRVHRAPISWPECSGRALLNPLPDVTLLANSVCLGKPCPELRVHISGSRKPESMNVVTRRDGLHLAKAGVLEPPRKHNVAVQPIRPRCDLRERHPHLESNARLLWKDAHRSDFANRRNDSLEKCPNFRPLAAEVMLKTESPAGVRLVSVREIPTAFLTLP